MRISDLSSDVCASDLHMSTRLVRGWTHLERQRGGSIGLRDPGETQLETDRRLLQKRVEQLSRRLDKVEVQRNQMRRARVRSSSAERRVGKECVSTCRSRGSQDR